MPGLGHGFPLPRTEPDWAGRRGRGSAAPARSDWTRRLQVGQAVPWIDWIETTGPGRISISEDGRLGDAEMLGEAGEPRSPVVAEPETGPNPLPGSEGAGARRYQAPSRLRHVEREVRLALRGKVCL